MLNNHWFRIFNLILFLFATEQYGSLIFQSETFYKIGFSIRFTMETEKDNKLAFLDTAVLREPDGRLTTSVYRKPTHTDQYLAHD